MLCTVAVEPEDCAASAVRAIAHPRVDEKHQPIELAEWLIFRPAGAVGEDYFPRLVAEHQMMRTQGRHIPAEVGFRVAPRFPPRCRVHSGLEHRVWIGKDLSPKPIRINLRFKLVFELRQSQAVSVTGMTEEDVVHCRADRQIAQIAPDACFVGTAANLVGVDPGVAKFAGQLASAGGQH